MYTQLNARGRAAVVDVARRHGCSEDAAEHLLWAVFNGGGTMAQFNHQELGGMGQWSMGGMIMVGDMFNNGLKARVDALCNDLSAALAREALFVEPEPAPTIGRGASFSSVSSGWPAELGAPSSQGAQNDMRYAIFPANRRLAVSVGGAITVYDTGDHQIGGVGQQQGADQSLTFTSQFGVVRLSDLPEIALASTSASREPAPSQNAREAPPQEPAPVAVEEPVSVAEPAAKAEPLAKAEPAPAAAFEAKAAPTGAQDDVIALIERLADLHARGILDDAEFQTKKTELLSRL